MYSQQFTILKAHVCSAYQLWVPRKKGKFWVWTKEEAEAWRRWFAEGKPESEEADVS